MILAETVLNFLAFAYAGASCSRACRKVILAVTVFNFYAFAHAGAYIQRSCCALHTLRGCGAITLISWERPLQISTWYLQSNVGLGHFYGVPHSVMDSALTQCALTKAHSQVTQLQMSAGYQWAPWARTIRRVGGSGGSGDRSGAQKPERDKHELQ